MPRLFISTCDGLKDPAGKRLFEAFKSRGFEIDHSPWSPHGVTQDPRWNSWYASGLRDALKQADAFVAFVNGAYDCSTWMATEYDEVFRMNRQTGRPRLFLYNEFQPSLPRGFSNYVAVSRRLPADPDSAADVVSHDLESPMNP